MADDYVVWMHKIEKGACDLLEFRGFKKSFRLKRGFPLADEWNDAVEMEMNDEHPEDTTLVDSLFNIKSLLVISDRLKSFLETQDLPDVELLPIRIKCHDGSYSPASYFVLNQTIHFDCLDAEKSNAKKSKMTSNIKEVQGIALKDTEVLEGRDLFRMKGFGDATLVKRSFAEKLDAQGFTGVRFGELKDFTDKTW